MANIYDVGDYLGITEPDRLTRGLKLAYYAQAWHLAWHGTPLFDEPIQAWKNGPVAPDLWIYAKSGRRHGKTGTLTPVEQATIDAVVDHYGAFTGSRLSNLTHAEAPWREARGELGPDDHSAEEIPHDRMRAWCVKQSLAGNGPVYRGPQAPAPSPADLDALDEWVAAHDADILEQLATR